MNYYTDLPHFISNSNLGDLHKALTLQQDKVSTEALGLIFDFGNLVDSAITEYELLDHVNRCVRNEASGQMMYFTKYDWDRAMKMRESALADFTFNMVLKHSKCQHVFTRRVFEFEYMGKVVYMPVRCKYDMLSKVMEVAADLKTTACKTEKAFRESMSTFKYFRQAAFYMDIARVDRMWYFGICKTPNKAGKHELFKFAINRDDENYLKGKAEYNKLGFLYKCMIYDLNINDYTFKLSA